MRYVIIGECDMCKNETKLRECKRCGGHYCHRCMSWHHIMDNAKEIIKKRLSQGSSK